MARPLGQAAKTSPSHGENGSSILPGVTRSKLLLAFFKAGSSLFLPVRPVDGYKRQFLFNASVANAPLIKEYDIASDFSVSFEEVVGMADSLVTKAGDGDFIIGVTQEEHTGEHDELNSRSDGTKIRINIAPDAVYEVPLPSYTAKSGTATTIVTDSSGPVSYTHLPSLRSISFRR